MFTGEVQQTQASRVEHPAASHTRPHHLVVTGRFLTRARTALGTPGMLCGDVVVVAQPRVPGALGLGGAPAADRFCDGVVGEREGAEKERCHFWGIGVLFFGGRGRWRAFWRWFLDLEGSGRVDWSGEGDCVWHTSRLLEVFHGWGIPKR